MNNVCLHFVMCNNIYPKESSVSRGVKKKKLCSMLHANSPHMGVDP
jgi:hypothetical protein